MAIEIKVTLTCDKCQIKTETDSFDTLPDKWLRVQGYGNIVNGLTFALEGSYCPTCVGYYGISELIISSTVKPQE